jgi:hypothetical protein
MGGCRTDGDPPIESVGDSATAAQLGDIWRARAAGLMLRSGVSLDELRIVD